MTGEVPEPGGTELRDVRGPSAIGGGHRRALELLWLLSVTEFRQTYFGTALGYLWSLLRPLLLFGVLLVVFTKIFRLGSDQVQDYPVFLLINIVLYSFFQEATTNATTSVVSQEAIVRKTQFPRLVIPMATVLTGVLNLGMNLIAVLLLAIVLGVTPILTWLLFPVVLLLLLVLTSATATLLSALYVRRRDVAIIWSVITTALFYGSAVLYPVSLVPKGFLTDLVNVNPLVPLFVQTNKWMIDSDAPSAVVAAGGWARLAIPVAIFAVTCAAAAWFFAREAPRVAEDI